MRRAKMRARLTLERRSSGVMALLAAAAGVAGAACGAEVRESGTVVLTGGRGQSDPATPEPQEGKPGIFPDPRPPRARWGIRALRHRRRNGP
ncbi:hypothetical protein GCM10023090_21950 [Acidovorax lacteus]|uniref:Uncharacterized protein n=1 Tax=Acidovorax lacteus TaxID=1924988 RepID=A0ABP8LC66_9BURK